MTGPVPVKINGQLFPSIAAAKRAFKTSYRKINQTLDRGETTITQKLPAPVTIRGVTYADAKTAAKALGVCYRAVTLARQTKRLDRVGLRNK